jgi:hypothetical protein
MAGPPRVDSGGRGFHLDTLLGWWLAGPTSGEAFLQMAQQSAAKASAAALPASDGRRSTKNPK